MPQRKVSVINHYAFPPGSGGITRNFDMFSRLRGWQPHFYAANINHTSGERMTVDDPRYTLVPIPQYKGNGVKRVLGWVAFAAGAGARALARPADVIFASSQAIRRRSPRSMAGILGIRRRPQGGVSPAQGAARVGKNHLRPRSPDRRRHEGLGGPLPRTRH